MFKNWFPSARKLQFNSPYPVSSAPTPPLSPAKSLCPSATSQAQSRQIFSSPPPDMSTLFQHFLVLTHVQSLEGCPFHTIAFQHRGASLTTSSRSPWTCTSGTWRTRSAPRPPTWIGVGRFLRHIIQYFDQPLNWIDSTGSIHFLLFVSYTCSVSYQLVSPSLAHATPT